MATIAHEKLTNLHGGKGIEGWIQPACSCGWKGKEHYAHNDYQHANAKDEFMRHRQEMKRRLEL